LVVRAVVAVALCSSGKDNNKKRTHGFSSCLWSKQG
jgi:hypothetical protein